MDALVRKKQKDLSDARGKSVGYEEAFSEVVADSMEAMLADGNVMDKIVRLKAQDRDIVARMKAFFDNLITKIRNAYKDIVPDSTEGYEVIKMTTDTIEQLQQLFAEALVESSENFRTAEKNTTEDGGVRLMSREGNTKKQLEDKYYARQIDKWDGKDHGGSFRVGKVSKPLLMIGIPDVDIWFDQSKAAKQLADKDEVTKAVLKKIPYLLEHPIAISESYDKTVVVFGEVYDDVGNPIVVALRVNSTNRRNHITLVNKIRSVGTRTHNLDKLLSDDSVLYLNEAKKETNRWFNALGRSTPFGGTKYGLIRIVSFNTEKSNIVNTNYNKNFSENVDVEIDTTTESAAPDILKSERTWTESDYVQDRQYSDRTGESVSSRTLLANALESTLQTDWERRKLQEYKDNISKIEEQEAKLQQLNAQIRELSFAKGPRDKAKLTELRIEATKTTNRINIYDKILLRLNESYLLGAV